MKTSLSGLRPVFDRAQAVQSFLETIVVVERYVVLDGRCEFAIGLELTQVVHLHFQGAPKTLDRGVVDATSDPGHAVGQPRIFYYAFEPSRCVLISSVAMDHRTRSCAEPCDRWHHRLEDERVVVRFPDAIGDDRAVIEVDDRAQIRLLPVAIFELGDVGAPFLVWSGRTEFPVHQVLGHMLRGRLFVPFSLLVDDRTDLMDTHETVVDRHGDPLIAVGPVHLVIEEMDVLK